MTGDAERVAANRAHWDDRAAVHAASRYYDLDGIVARGPAPIRGPDEAELGDVAGLSLLHLHCHLGTDTLRWAALGAEVTGVDISPGSLAVARTLAARLRVDVRFVEADVADLPAVLPEGGGFDVVYASHGVICWVPDLPRWAEVAASFARPGGVVYLAEGHPIHAAFDPERFGRTGYLDTGPRRFVDRRSYTDGDTDLPRPENYRWAHTLGDVVTAFAGAGLRIDFLHEHPQLPRRAAATESAVDWRPRIPPAAPGSFSLKATRPER